MKQAIPDSMQRYFLGTFCVNGAIVQTFARKALTFIGLLKNDNPDITAMANALLLKEKMPRQQVTDLMTMFLSAGTIWPVPGVFNRGIGYQLETSETLIEHDEEEVVVIELSASEIGLVSKKREANEPREWFDKAYPSDLLAAIECRLEIPKTMYTGLDNMGNNLGE